MEIIHEKSKEMHRNWRNLGLGARFKSCVTVQAPAQFGTHKNDSFQVFRIRNLVQKHGLKTQENDWTGSISTYGTKAISVQTCDRVRF